MGDTELNWKDRFLLHNVLSSAEAAEDRPEDEALEVARGKRGAPGCTHRGSASSRTLRVQCKFNSFNYC